MQSHNLQPGELIVSLDKDDIILECATKEEAMALKKELSMFSVGATPLQDNQLRLRTEKRGDLRYLTCGQMHATAMLNVAELLGLNDKQVNASDGFENSGLVFTSLKTGAAPIRTHHTALVGVNLNSSLNQCRVLRGQVGAARKARDEQKIAEARAALSDYLSKESILPIHASAQENKEESAAAAPVPSEPYEQEMQAINKLMQHYGYNATCSLKFSEGADDTKKIAIVFKEETREKSDLSAKKASLLLAGRIVDGKSIPKDVEPLTNTKGKPKFPIELTNFKTQEKTGEFALILTPKQVLTIMAICAAVEKQQKEQAGLGLQHSGLHRPATEPPAPSAAAEPKSRWWKPFF